MADITFVTPEDTSAIKIPGHDDTFKVNARTVRVPESVAHHLDNLGWQRTHLRAEIKTKNDDGSALTLAERLKAFTGGDGSVEPILGTTPLVPKPGQGSLEPEIKKELAGDKPGKPTDVADGRLGESTEGKGRPVVADTKRPTPGDTTGGAASISKENVG
jgi:hypothetical protein